MALNGEAFRNRTVARLLAPESADAGAIAKKIWGCQCRHYNYSVTTRSPGRYDSAQRSAEVSCRHEAPGGCGISESLHGGLLCQGLLRFEFLASRCPQFLEQCRVFVQQPK